MLVDTDVLIWYMRGHREARARLDSAAGFSISAVTYMEAAQGMRSKAELRVFKRALSAWSTPILPITERITHEAMSLVDRFSHGYGVRMADALIGATALAHGLPLHTANERHYRPMTGLTVVVFHP